MTYKRIFITLAATILAALLAMLVFNNLKAVFFAAVSGFIGGAVAAYYFGGQDVRSNMERAATRTVNTVAGATIVTPRADREYASVLAALEALNQKLRLTIGVSSELLSDAEQLFDALADLTKRLCIEHPDDEMTWGMCRMATRTLPDVITPYLSASANVRYEATSQIAASLAAMKREVDEIAQLLDQKDIVTARTRAKAAEIKYGGMIA